MRPYVFLVESYDHTSVGNVAMHKLCHLLNKRGLKAYMSCKWVNPEWNTPIVTPEIGEEDPIFIYTDRVIGNPANATTVVRWIMNTPEFYREVMKWKDWGNFKATDLIFTYLKEYYPDAPELFVSIIDRELFKDEHLPRKGILYYIGKAKFDASVKIERVGKEITSGKNYWPKTRKELAYLLKTSEKLICYANSALMDEAVLCGCPVEFRGNKKYKVADTNDVLQRYKLTEKQIDNFIQITQNHHHPTKIKERQTVSLDFHDFSIENNNLYYFYRLREIYPDIKFSMFFVPVDIQHFQKLYEEQKKIVLKQIQDGIKEGWLELIPHGLTHATGEFKNASYKDMEVTLNAYVEFFTQNDLPYVKGFCAPNWLISQPVIDCLNDHGWWLAIDRNQPLALKAKKCYIYNWSIEEPYPYDKKIVMGHGHIDTCDNNITLNMHNLTKIPSDAKFEFVSTLMKKLYE